MSVAYTKWLLLIISALLYPLAFLWSEAFWWVTFLFLIPLYYAASKYQLSFKEGYVWGAIALALHLSGVLYSIFLMAEGSYFFRLIPTLFVIFYEALFMGIAFWLAYRTILLFKIRSLALKLSIWTIIMWGLFHWFDHYCLWLFGICEGYFFMHPLLPLATQPKLLSLLPVIGKEILSLILCVTGACLTLVVINKKLLWGLLFITIAVLPWFISWQLPAQKNQAPSWLSKVALLPERFNYPDSPQEMAIQLQQKLKSIAENHPQVELVLLPEGSIYPCDLTKESNILCFWNASKLQKPLSLVLGGNRWEDNKFYNTLYWIENGTIKHWFDKRHGMLLTERLSPLWDIPILRKLYFSKIPAISVSTNKRPLWELLPGVKLVPYICSETFFNEYPDDSFQQYPILALCNDRWLYTNYVSTLMLLVARFKAIQWQREILYLSFKYAAYIFKNGML